MAGFVPAIRLLCGGKTRKFGDQNAAPAEQPERRGQT